ncbi:putative glycoside hydrolase [Clostridium sp. E02]|uniref:putative glycoside hydrolase n=1 Tax=Clostridium sp. E02 TaxID=2487134 RepID=UPI000F53A938|nr:putative glycoside hydrolase [Clostridium sp. E02]
MKKWLIAIFLCSLVATGCSRYRRDFDGKESDRTRENPSQSTEEKQADISKEVPEKTVKKPVKVKGIYISGFMAGSEGFTSILDQIQGTEINTVVIDVKNDDGRITFDMGDALTVKEIGAQKRYIRNMDALMKELKSRGIYTIARVVAFRDPYLAEQKPEWSLKNKDGTLYRDKNGLAWVNPYKKEVWDYLIEIGTQAHKSGFDEIQFDYIRFSTDSSMKRVAFDEGDTKGRSKTDIITEFVQYASDKLSVQGVRVSADVFGTIIGSSIDANAVGQDYCAMAEHLDYISPMIYPSHYGDGNFGIEHPDTQPYDTIRAALKLSKKDLNGSKTKGKKQAVVRPWLQDFTASYLKHHIPYGKKEIRDQIQAVYDAGYDEWILWSASNRYTWDAFLSKEDGIKEAEQIKQSREAAGIDTEIQEPEEPVLSAHETKSQDEEAEEAIRSLEGKIATDESEPDEKKGDKTDHKKETRSKPNVVIVTTGRAGR